MKRDSPTLTTANISEQEINAWIDGELVEPEHSQFAAAMTACPELAARVCALQSLKSLLQRGYSPATLPLSGPAAQRVKTGSHS